MFTSKKKTSCYITIMITTLLAATLLLTAACGPEEHLPSDYRKVVSVHKTFQYLIPMDWNNTGFNSYGTGNSKVIEQIYPSSKITEEYCRSFVYSRRDNYNEAIVENRIHNTGRIQGCLITRDILNLQLNTKWRNTRFAFPTANGNESLTVIVPLGDYDKERILTIINSVQIR